MKVVKLYHIGSWYYVYQDDAYVVANVTGYKLYENPRSGIPTVSFPEYVIANVIDELASRKINYILPNDENKLKDFKEINQYNHYLKKDSFVSYQKPQRKKITGSFTVQYNQEPYEEFIINQNINAQAKLVQKVIQYNIGDIFTIGDSQVKIIAKNIQYDK